MHHRDEEATGLSAMSNKELELEMMKGLNHASSGEPKRANPMVAMQDAWSESEFPEIVHETRIPPTPPDAALKAHAAALVRGKKIRIKLPQQAHPLGLSLSGGVSKHTDLYEIIVTDLPQTSQARSVAELAGVKIGDEILEVQGRKVGQRGGLTVADTIKLLKNMSTAQKPTICVLRPSVSEQVLRANSPRRIHLRRDKCRVS